MGVCNVKRDIVVFAAFTASAQRYDIYIVVGMGDKRYRVGGTRGGQDQFKWDDVKADVHRENYLGHSLLAPVGRWQRGENWGAAHRLIRMKTYIQDISTALVGW